MILITADIINEGLPKRLCDYEHVYKFISKVKEGHFAEVVNDRVYILVDNNEDYFKLCFELILAINSEQLLARLFISQSNEPIEVSKINVIDNSYQVFVLNNELRKKCLKSRTYKMTDHFTIRAHHPTLDSILYSLSTMCFKYERNLEILYDKYYLGLTQIEIANKHQMSQVAISKKLRSNNYSMFKLIVGRL